jgi:ArsR family transcriptional regulator
MESIYEKEAKVFKALCDPRRLAILERLRSGEKCLCMLQEDMDIGQSGLSYHMKILCDSGIVESRQDGKWTHYRLSDSGSEKAASLLRELTTPNIEQKIDCCR